jgi:hypothetical protein
MWLVLDTKGVAEYQLNKNRGAGTARARERSFPIIAVAPSHLAIHPILSPVFYTYKNCHEQSNCIVSNSSVLFKDETYLTLLFRMLMSLL